MTDIYSKEKRSLLMSKVPGKETKHEILIRSFLFSKGFRFRKNVKQLAGKPDIVIQRYQTIIFMNGCFWHGHSCKAGKLPKTNIEFWKAKIEANVIRDQKNIAELEDQGWKVIVIWQCQIKTKKAREAHLPLLVNLISNHNPSIR